MLGRGARLQLPLLRLVQQPLLVHQPLAHLPAVETSAVAGRATYIERKVSDPHPVSNIRELQHSVPFDESAAERTLRSRLAELHEWHQQFWINQNQKFDREKEEFSRKYRRDNKLPDNAVLTAEVLSTFYKDHLDRNLPIHRAYNREWWRKNLSMMIPWMNAYGQQLLRRMKNKDRAADVTAAAPVATTATIKDDAAAAAAAPDAPSAPEAAAAAAAAGSCDDGR
eukprot:m.97944 g.97944  ORF g.97944 m.97944 type:complete len:225 (-) comp15546_c0_seq11:3413-4087(-)